MKIINFIFIFLIGCEKPIIQEDGTILTMEEKLNMCEYHLQESDEDLVQCRRTYNILCDVHYDTLEQRVGCYNACECGQGHIGIGEGR